MVGRHAIRFFHAQPAVGGLEWCAPNATSSAFAQLTVGNGDFAFTADLSGLQSLNRSYGSSSDFGFPALTQASWGWHTPDPRWLDPTMPSPYREDGSPNITYEDFPVISLDERPGHGNRSLPYLVNCEQHNDPRLCHWWYNFPVRTSLGQLAFVTQHSDGVVAPLAIQDIRNSSQHLDLYTSVLSSNWTVGGHRAKVTTVADDESTDTVATQFTAPLAMGLTVQLAFCAPGTVAMGTKTVGNKTQLGNGGMQACDWLQPSESHTTSAEVAQRGSRLDLTRKLEYDEYSVSCTASHGEWQRRGPHSFVLSLPAPAINSSQGERTLSVSCRYALVCCVGAASPKPPDWLGEQVVPEFTAVHSRAVESARVYWESGAFVDLAGATSDPRASKLERIVIQSQGLLRTMEAGAAPPQESGLLFNSWRYVAACIYGTYLFLPDCS